MLWADSEEIFQDAVNNIKNLVPSTNIDLMVYVNELSATRGEYTKYIIQSYYGNKFLVGSSYAESNHSSIVHFFSQGSSSLKRSKHTAHHYVKLLINREQKSIKLMNSTLAELNTQRINNRRSLEILQDVNVTTSDKNNILLPAVDKLCVKSMEIFMKQFALSKKYLYIINELGHTIVTCGDATNNERKYTFETPLSRCICKDRTSLMIMCRHELSFQPKFIADYFDPSHYFRTKLTYSLDTDFNNAEDTQESRVIIHPKANNTVADDEDTEEPRVIIHPEANRTVASTFTAAFRIPSTSHNYSSLQALFNDALKVVSNAEQQIKNGIAAMISEITRVCYTKHSSSNHTILVSTIDEMVVKLSSLQLHDSTTEIIKRQGTRAVNRIRSIQEIHKTNNSGAGGSILSQTAPKSCKFCKSTEHNIAKCHVKSSYGDVKTYGDFIDLVQRSSPYRILEEGENVDNYLPEGTFYLCILGVIVKRNPAGAQVFDRDDIVLSCKCISSFGIEIDTQLFHGTAIFSKIEKTPSRTIFVDFSNCVGGKWFIRRKE